MINIGNFNIYPNDIDYVQLEQQGLCKDGNLNDTYFKLYNTYLSLFYDILNDNGLNCFDNDLENSNLHFNQVEKEDMGKIIGKQGKVAQAIRTLIKSIGAKEKKKIVVKFVE